MSLDSTAVFSERVASLRLTAHAERFEAAGWHSYADLAFSTPYVPGQGDDERFLKDVVEKGLGTRESGDLAALRRLFFEAYSLAVADLKRKVEQSSDDLPRRIPTAERQERRLVVERRLVGISLTGELDVSNRLLDAVIQLAEDNVLRYIPWEECTARALELNGVKKDPAWTTDTAGHIKAIAVAKPLVANADSELKLHFALKRRGLAFEMGDLMQFELHERLVEKMIAAYMRPAIDGHKKVDVAQIERADKEAFRLMAERTRGGIRRDGTSVRPLDTAILQVLDDPDFRVALQPLPGSSRSAAPPGVKRSAENENDDGRRKRKTTGQRLREMKQKLQGTAADDGKKGEGKGKTRMPSALIGKLSALPDGRRICFNFNLTNGCDAAPPGASCNRGAHVCCEPGCGKPHSLQSHQK